MSTPVIDHIALGLSRIITQYREQPKFVAFIIGLMAISNDIEACLQQELNLANIDMMSGYNLDVIGIIVAAPRIVTGVVSIKWFGFNDTGTYATVFGEEGIPNIGSRFYEEGEVLSSTTLLQDPEYRLVIRAKIVKNNSSCTPEDIISGLRFIFNTPDVLLTDNSLDPVTPRPSISIGIGRPIYAYEQALITALDILPRPGGIAIEGGVTSYAVPAPGYTGGMPPYDPTGGS